MEHVGHVEHVERVEVEDILRGFDYKSFANFAVQFQGSQFKNVRFHKKERGFVVDFNSSDRYEIFIKPGNIFFGPRENIPEVIREQRLYNQVIALNQQINEYKMPLGEKSLVVPHSLCLIESLNIICVADRENGR